jgi:hypothetical protein
MMMAEKCLFEMEFVLAPVTATAIHQPGRLKPIFFPHFDGLFYPDRSTPVFFVCANLRSVRIFAR